MTSCDRLRSDTSIPQGFSLVSENLSFYFTVQANAELVLFSKDQKLLWSSGSANQGKGPFRLRMHLDGNLTLYDDEDQNVWSSNTKNVGTPPYQLKLQNDGDLNIFDTSGKVIWSTKTAEKAGEQI